MVKEALNGNVIYFAKRYFYKTLGHEEIEKILSMCSKETREMYNSTIMSSEFYPQSMFADFVKSAFKTLGIKKVKRVTREMAKSQLKTVIAIYMKLFVSPNKYAEWSPRIWKKLHNIGELTVEHSDDKTQTVRIRGFDFGNKESAISFGEYRCGIIEAIGKKDVGCKIEIISPKEYVFKFNWT